MKAVKIVPTIIVLTIFIIAIGLFIFTYVRHTSSVSSEPVVDQIIKPLATTTTTIEIRTIVSTSSPRSYAYLFEGKREAMTSNIVGYFGGGAFAWYVPDWLVTNWRMTSYDTGMVFIPLVRDNPADFGDISFTLSTSTELYNAENLYQTRLDTILKSDLISNEVLLNKLGSAKTVGPEINLQIETDTRIYHIIDMDGDGIHMRDSYYMDGNAKTLVIMIEAKSEVFPQFTDKIRDMVEGIGELKSPQG